MKKKIVETQDVCDFCQKDGAIAWDKCLGCGLDICSSCKESDGIEYKHAVYFMGTYDGFYCAACDKEAERIGDPLHAAYRAVAALKNEHRNWSEHFDKRRQGAEVHLKALRSAAK